MKNKKYRVLVTIVLIAGAGAYAYKKIPLNIRYRSELKSLIVPPEKLPARCEKITEVGIAPIFPATSNPFVTDQPQLIDFVSTIGFGFPTENATAAFSAMYFQDVQSNEIGVWGLQFKNQNLANAHAKANAFREIVQKDALILTLWTDNESGKPCQEAIKNYLLQHGYSNRGK